MTGDPEGIERLRGMRLHRFAPDDTRMDGTAIFLHGRNGAAVSAHADAITSALRRRGTVIAPDLRFSDANESEGRGRDFSFDALLDDARAVLAHVLEAAPAGRLLLAGHSVGGYAALTLAAEAGEAVAGVLGVAPARSGQSLLDARTAMGPGAMEALAAELPGALADFPRHDVMPLAPRIAQPVALLVGEKDGLTTPRDVAMLAGALPRVVGHEVLPGVDHCPAGPVAAAACARLVDALDQASQ